MRSHFQLVNGVKRNMKVVCFCCLFSHNFLNQALFCISRELFAIKETKNVTDLRSSLILRPLFSIQVVSLTIIFTLPVLIAISYHSVSENNNWTFEPFVRRRYVRGPNV